MLGALSAVGVDNAYAQPSIPLARTEFLQVGSRRRRYRVVAPRESAGGPLVLALHGVGDSPANMASYSHLDEAAAQRGWVLAYPEAANGRWPYFSQSQMDAEVRFCDALISRLIDEYAADPARVHLTGMSGGAFFINIVAARLSQRVASIAVHSGGAGILGRDGIHAHHRYAVLIIHGVDDDVAPVEDGRALAALYRREGHQVEMVEYPRWGHRWAYSLGVNDTIAAFFQRHPRA